MNLKTSIATLTLIYPLLQAINTAACADSTGTFKIESRTLSQPWKQCLWASRKPHLTTPRCKIIEVSQNCPQTCGTCPYCSDESGTFKLLNGSVKSCNWAKKITSKIDLRCGKYPTKFKCRATCRTCLNSPSPAPTLSNKPTKNPTRKPTDGPTITPTRAPSPTPSKSSIPSKAPSSSPTAKPSFICVDNPGKFTVRLPTGDFPKQCSWVAAKSTNMRCQFSTFTGTVADECRIICKNCPNQPSSTPTSSPAPSNVPSPSPTSKPSSTPTNAPSAKPSTAPSAAPSKQPSSQPFAEPSTAPSDFPTLENSGEPTSVPSSVPTGKPTGQPSTPPTGKPSSQPSAAPTVCAEEPGWIVSGPGIVSFTCNDIGTNLAFCDLLEAPEFMYNRKTIKEACCKCGGSTLHTSLPSISPSPTKTQVPTSFPSSAPTKCEDEPAANWTLSGIITCAVVNSGNCNTFTGSNNGKTVNQACCACGGGQHVVV